MRHHLRLSILFLCGITTYVACFSASPAVAQKTITTNTAPDHKQEFDYDAAGRLTEVRSITSAGLIESRDTTSYGPHGEVLTQKVVSYQADGRTVKGQTEISYDENGNFLSEVVVELNPQGKQSGGHSVIHDPRSGIYRCFEWNKANARLSALECPAGEEEHEGTRQIRSIQRDEVLQQLTSARAAVAEGNATSIIRAVGDGTSRSARVGFVLPSVLMPGVRVSGSLVPQPERFVGRAGLQVVPFDLPLPSGADAVSIADWSIEVAGSKGNAASPLSFLVPAGPNVSITASLTAGSSESLSKNVAVSAAGTKVFPKSPAFESPALCLRRDVCLVQGIFTGDAGETFAAFEGNPARILAETPSALYLEVPPFMNLGQSVLAVQAGKQIAAMMIVVADVHVSPSNESVESGQEIGTGLRASEIAELDEHQWQYGVYPASNLDEARKLLPGLDPRKTAERLREANEKQLKKDGLHRKEEKWEESAGWVLIAIRNLTPEVGAFRGVQGPQIVFTLSPDSFGRGDFVYSQSIDVTRSGTLSLQSVVIPFLAPVRAEMITADAP